MPANTTTQTAGYVLNLGVVGIAGSLFGMPLEALILGGISGAVMQGLNKEQPQFKGLSAILASMVLAGSFSPAIIHYLHHELGMSEVMTRAFVPVLIGGGWTYFIPYASNFLKGYIRHITAKLPIQWVDDSKNKGGKHE